ncbi:hypothetical protein [Flavobacterium piscisymbiosum]|uniref:Uncharacterized protein n=1 Tax=Flavobacterium piscisymbiosum TaxID=2893753 RepID=A0ABS8MIM3_9FLAO|nr:hypothetical protein [Flavobacterium sp. F-30]MCC9065340.1 hypothetical protein [Flavobacterium sp. F-30]
MITTNYGNFDQNERFSINTETNVGYQCNQNSQGYMTVREQLLNWGEDPKYPDTPLSNTDHLGQNFNEGFEQENAEGNTI